MLCERLERQLAPMRVRYIELMSQPERIESILQEGAAKARKLSAPLMAELREAVGLRQSAKIVAKGAAKEKAGGKKLRFVSFRDEAGDFRFRLLAADGQ